MPHWSFYDIETKYSDYVSLNSADNKCIVDSKNTFRKFIYIEYNDE